MSSFKLSAGQQFPTMTISKVGGGEISLGKSSESNTWQLIVVYRGKHCPMCTSYLQEPNEILPKLKELNVEVVAVSADPEAKVLVQLAQVNPNFDVGYDLSIRTLAKVFHGRMKDFIIFLGRSL